MTSNQNKSADVVDAQARRAAAAVGLRASKSRDRHLHSNNRGGFMLDESGYVLWGANYELSPHMVIEICEDLKAEASRLDVDPGDVGWQSCQFELINGKLRVCGRKVWPPQEPLVSRAEIVGGELRLSLLETYTRSS